MVKILYFAGLREATGSSSEELVLPTGVADIDGLLSVLRARGGAWTEALAADRRVRAAVKQDMASGDTPVRDGDEVAFGSVIVGF